jgi:hypothetical protein
MIASALGYRWRMTMRTRSVMGLAAFALILASCAQSTPSPSAPPPPLLAEANDAEYKLVISSSQAVWDVDEAIQVAAQLSYSGPEREIASSAGGVISFSVEEVGGSRKMEAIRDAACASWSIGRGLPITAAYQKSGGINPGEPNEAFYGEFFEDPLFHLPSGEWKITAFAQFKTGPGCRGGRDVDLRASLVIPVE